MALNAAAVAELMKRYNITAHQLAPAIDRSPDTVSSWLTGQHDAPAYLERTIAAVVAGKPPAPVSRMIKTGADGLASMLGIQISSARYWCLTEQFPRAARLAVASYDIPENAPDRLTPRDRQLLTRLEVSKHYRTRNGYRARPTIGKPLPLMKFETVRDLRARGLITPNETHGLTLTPRAKGLLYR